MAETIDWKSLGFNFSDDSPLKELIDQMNAAIDTSNQMAATLVANNKKIVGEMEDYVKEAQKVAESVKAINTESAGSGKQLSEAAKETDKLTTSTATLVAIEQDNAKMIAALQAQIESLTKAKKDSEKANLSEAGSLNDLKKQLLDAEKKYRELGQATDADGKKREAQKKQVSDLARQFNTANKALAEAKKANDTIKGSYQELAQKVAMAKKELKEMSDGFDKSNPKVQSLSKFIKEGSDKLKDFDKAIGDNQRSVGDYEIATRGLSKATGGLSDVAITATQSLKGLFLNPWVLAATALIGTFLALKKSLETFYTATGEGEDILAQRIAGWSSALDVLRNKFAESAGFIDKTLEATSNHFFIMLTGTVALFSRETAKAMIDAKKTGIEIAKEADALADDMIDNIVKRANAEKVISQANLESQDKANKSDQERLGLLKVIGIVRKNQLQEELDLEKRRLDNIEKEIANRHSISVEQLRSLNREQQMALLSEDELKERTRIYEQRAKIIDLETQFASEQKRTQKQQQALEQEIEKARIDRINREIDERRKLNKLILDDEIKINEDVLKKDESTSQDRIVALDNIAQLRIKQLEIDKATELDVVRRAAEDRIRAEGKEVTDALLASDKALAIEREAIALKFTYAVKGIVKGLQNDLQGGVFKTLLEDFNDLTTEVSKKSKTELIALNEAFVEDDKKTSKDYEEAKTEIQVYGEGQRLQATIDYWEAKIAIDKSFGKDTTDDEAKLVDAQLALSDYEVKRRLENDKKVVESKKNLIQALQTTNQFVQGGFEIFRNSLDAEDQRIQQSTDNLQKVYDEQIQLAGDNEEAKKLIEKQYNDDLEAQQKEQAKIRHKAAQAEKAAAAFSVAINTATAIIAALAPPPLGLGPVAGLPLSLKIGALGLVQELAILTKSVPEFEKGTNYAPEGLAVVAENHKPELGIDTKGKVTLYDTENADGMLAYLTRGTKIISGDETERILAGDSFNSFGEALIGAKKTVRKETKQKAQALNPRSITDPIVNELKKNRPRNIVRIVNDMYEVHELEDGSKKYIRAKSMNK
jgi:hypothetical protein